MTEHKLRCMTCKNRQINPNDDYFCTILDDWIDFTAIDFTAKVGCASHSDTVKSHLECPDRVQLAFIADCRNYSGGGIPYVCSAKRYHEQCPRGLPADPEDPREVNKK